LVDPQPPRRGHAPHSNAKRQLGLDPPRDYSSVVLYFETCALAQQFVDLLEPGVVGTAAVMLFCLD
jgi:hypothetical protein